MFKYAVGLWVCHLQPSAFTVLTDIRGYIPTILCFPSHDHVFVALSLSPFFIFFSRSTLWEVAQPTPLVLLLNFSIYT